MSEKYTFSLSIEIDNNIPSEDIAVIEYLFGEKSSIPRSLPKHSYFESFALENPYHFQYRDFTKHAYTATTWIQHDSLKKVDRRFIELRLPSNKLEEIYEIKLPFASWLANISCKSGFMGSFSLESSQDFNPMLLFIYNGELYIGNTEEAFSFSTGTKLAPTP